MASHQDQDPRAPLQIRLFGEFTVERNGEAATRPQRQHAEDLWALLLLSGSVPRRRDEAAFALWPDVAERTARANLRRHLSHLRAYLDSTVPDAGTLLVDRRTLQWSLSPGCVLDVEQFETLCLEPERFRADETPEPDPAHLEQAISLYRGDLLQDAGAEWILAKRERLEALFVQALDRLATIQESRGQLAAALANAERIGDRLPLSEDEAQRRMRLHGACGDHRQALRVFEAWRQRLWEELRSKPTPATLALRDAIAAGETPGAITGDATATDTGPPAAAQPPADRAGAPPPRFLSTFVGRRQALAACRSLLASERIVTLTGMGGCGKTRLASEVASRVTHEHADGVWWIDLAAVSDPELVVPQVASALGVRAQGGEPLESRIINHLESADALLVVDNCEHVVGAAAEVIGDIVTACGGVRVLATSREALGVDGEVVWEVTPLPVPAPADRRGARESPSSESEELLLDRVRALWPGFQPAPADDAAVAEICSRLEGIPLAIEMAAARASVLTLPDIAGRVTSGRGVLRASSRSRPSRHQTMEAVIDWSCRLLPPSEHSLLERLSVFEGGFTVDAAQAVCADAGRSEPTTVQRDDVPRLITRLYQKSLVVRTTDADGDSRYRLLQVVRQFGEDRLEAAGELASREQMHAEHFLEMAERAAPHLADADAADWLGALESDIANQRRAMRWMQEHDAVESALRLVAALYRFWIQHGHLAYERPWVERMLSRDRAGVPVAVAADALSAASGVAYTHGDFNGARDHCGEAIALYQEIEDLPGSALALDRLAAISVVLGDYDDAESACSRSIVLRREMDDQVGLAASMLSFGEIHMRRGDLRAARSVYEQSLVVLRRLGGADSPSMQAVLRGLAIVAQEQGDHVAAREHLDQALEIARARGDRAVLAGIYADLGRLLNDQGEYAEAAARFRELLEVGRALENESYIARAVNNLGETALREGNYDTAAAYLRDNIARCERIGDDLSLLYSHINASELAYYAGDLDDARRQATTGLSSARAQVAKFEVAWALGSLARTEIALGDRTDAAEHLREALEIADWQGTKRFMAVTIDVCALLAVAADQMVVAAKLAGGADGIRELIGAPRTHGEAADYDRCLAAVRAAIGEGDADHALVDGLRLSPDEAVAMTREWLASP